MVHTERFFNGNARWRQRLAGVILMGLCAAGVKAQYYYGQPPVLEAAHGANTDYIDPGRFDENAVASLIFQMTNAERARHGLAPVAHHPAAAAAATQHSRDMAARSYFDHKSKGLIRRSNPAQRMAAHGYSPRTSAENIAMVPTFNSQIIQTSSDRTRTVTASDPNGYHRLAQFAMQEWMKSPGHRRNILNGQLTTLGVGAAVGYRGNVPYVYLTQDFGG